MYEEASYVIASRRAAGGQTMLCLKQLLRQEVLSRANKYDADIIQYENVDLEKKTSSAEDMRTFAQTRASGET